MLIQRFRFYWRHSWNDLRVNRQRTIFGLFCIATGVATVVGLLSLGVIIRNTLTGSLQETNGGDIVINNNLENNDILIEQLEARIAQDQLVSDLGGDFTSDGIANFQSWLNEAEPALIADPNSDFTTYLEVPNRTFVYGDTDASAYLFFVDTSTFPIIGEVADAEGNALSDLLAQPNSIVLSSTLASDLGLQLNDTVTINHRPQNQTFTLRGIIPSSNDLTPGVSRKRLSYAYLAYASLPQFQPTESSSFSSASTYLFLKLANPEAPESATDQITDRYPYLDVGTLENDDLGNLYIRTSSRETVILTYIDYLAAQDNMFAEDTEGFGGSISLAGATTIENWLQAEFPDDFDTLTYQVVAEDGIVFAVNPDTGTSTPTFLSTVEKDKYPLYGTVETDDGKTLPDLLREPTDTVISQNLADTLALKIGDQLQFFGANYAIFTVRGIVPTETEGGLTNFFLPLLGYAYLDVPSMVYFDQTSADTLPTLDEVDLSVSNIYIRLNNPNPTRLEEINNAFKQRFPYLGSTTTEDLRRLNESISKGTNQMISVIGLVSLLIGGIGIVNTMLVIVRRRTNEIAVLKTLGLQPNEITTLFLVEAVIMGIVGSLIGVVAGWGVAYVMKFGAEVLFAQPIIYQITFLPALQGFVLGVTITAIFGLMPTLAAGQVRPAMVLRPADTVIPRTGRASGFAALFIVMLLIAMVAQNLIGDLVDIADIRPYSGGVGGFLGGLIGLSLSFSGMLRYITDRDPILNILRWIVPLPLGIGLGYLFGHSVESLLLLAISIIALIFLYIGLWSLIWSIGRGLPALINLLPAGVSRRLVDTKVAMRAMLATKGRGASTLLALVVGVFTLSFLTMMIEGFKNIFEDLQIDAVGGNVIILTVGDSLPDIESKLTRTTPDGEIVLADGIQSYAIFSSFPVKNATVYDESDRVNLTLDDLVDRLDLTSNEFEDDEEPEDWKPAELRRIFSSLDGRSVQSNLPNGDLVEGRQLNSKDALPLCPESNPDSIPCTDFPPIVVVNHPVIEDIELSVGDRISFTFENDMQITFEVVGILESTGIQTFGATMYVPIDVFRSPNASEFLVETETLGVIVNMREDRIGNLRRQIANIPNERAERNESQGFAFLLETRFFNDLIIKIIEVFTLFPQIVAALALAASGAVIANSVALSTMERRREIAIMKSIGMSRFRVLGMLIVENAIMGFIGGLIGVGIGVIILFLLQEYVFEIDESIIPYDTVFLLMSACVGISIVAALLSVWNASSEHPLNVLRYE